MSSLVNWFNSRFVGNLVDADVAYNKHSKLDVYAPKRSSTKLRPVVIFWHGGSWTHGDKSFYRFLAHNLAKRLDAVVVVPNYRLFPEVKYPHFVDEAWHVVQWVQHSAKKYNADPQKYNVIGHSSGAHTACSIALGFRKPKSLLMPQKCVSLAGPNYIVEKTFWPVFDMKTYDYTKFPANFAVTTQPPTKTKFLVVHGRLDRIVDQRQSIQFVSALRRAKISVQTIYPLIGHVGLVISIGTPFGSISVVARRVINFLE
jgi:acetyl esterase/lipase